MPRYLRWIAAATAALVAQFAFFIAVGALAVGTDNRDLTGAAGMLITLGAAVIPVIVGLGVSDWLSSRYPADAPARDEDPLRDLRR